MTLEYFQNQQNQSQQQQPVSNGNSPYNRYVPPTFNWGRGGLTGNQPQYNQMNWNQMRGFNLPTQDGRSSGPNQYASALQQMLAQFGAQYGDPNRRPTVPQFGEYGGGGRGRGGFNPFDPYAEMPQGPRMTPDEMMPAWFEQMFGRSGLGSLTPNSRSMAGVGSGEGEVKPSEPLPFQKPLFRNG